MPHSTTLGRASRCSVSTTDGTAQQLNATLSGRSRRRLSSSGTVEPSPLGYCSVASTGICSRRQASIRKTTLRTIRSASRIFGISRSCTSITTRAVSAADILIGCAISSLYAGCAALLGMLHPGPEQDKAVAPREPRRLTAQEVSHGRSPSDNPAGPLRDPLRRPVSLLHGGLAPAGEVDATRDS